MCCAMFYSKLLVSMPSSLTSACECCYTHNCHRQPTHFATFSKFVHSARSETNQHIAAFSKLVHSARDIQRRGESKTKHFRKGTQLIQYLPEQFQNGHVVLTQRFVCFASTNNVTDECWPVTWPLVLQNLAMKTNRIIYIFSNLSLLVYLSQLVYRCQRGPYWHLSVR